MIISLYLAERNHAALNVQLSDWRSGFVRHFVVFP